MPDGEERADPLNILALIIKTIGISDFERIRDEIDVRKRIQKTVYLLKLPAFDLDLGHTYNLYIAGPYSPDLSKQYYHIACNSSRYFVATQTMCFVPRIERAFKEFERGFGDYRLLECAATLHYLCDRSFRHEKDPSARQEKAIDYLLTIKPEYRASENTIKQALLLIERLNTE